MTFTPKQIERIAGLWNDGAAPNTIAMRLGGGATDQDVRDQLRKMDLARATRPAEDPSATVQPEP